MQKNSQDISESKKDLHNYSEDELAILLAKIDQSSDEHSFVYLKESLTKPKDKNVESNQKLWHKVVNKIALTCFLVVVSYLLLSGIVMAVGDFLTNIGMGLLTYFALLLLPLFLAMQFAMPVLIVVGFITALISIFTTHKFKVRLLWIAMCIIFVVISIFLRTSIISSNKELDNSKRLMGKDEAVGLINNCKVGSLTKQASEKNEVYVSYRNNYDDKGKWIWQPNYADGKYYDEYVKAAENSKGKCGETSYTIESTVQ